MTEKSIIIIGAGLAGLATGFTRGERLSDTILEHAAKPGGVAAWWRRGAYHIDGGIHFLMSHRAGCSPFHDCIAISAPPHRTR